MPDYTRPHDPGQPGRWIDLDIMKRRRYEMAPMMNAFELLYQQAKESVLIVRHPQPGVLRLRGEDRLSFLHRMSTNDIETMEVGSLRATTLTTPLARVIDRLWLIARPGSLLALSSSNREETVLAWLRKHIFYNDRVEVALATQNWSLWGAYGPQAEAHVLESLGMDTVPQPGEVVETPIGLVLGWPSPDGIRLLLNAQGKSIAESRWPDASTGLAADVFETLRVEAGYPLFGAEFGKDSIPLEVGLKPTVDFEKGCYTGQEIIARMDSRGQLARTLVGFRLTEQAEQDDLKTQDGQAAGVLTSCAYSPSMGWIGLGLVRTKILELKGDLFTASGQQKVEITSLPFENAS